MEIKQKHATNQELIAIANYDAGMCLCGHGETCSVCSRSRATRNFEDISRELALSELLRRGVSLRRNESSFHYARDMWEIVESSDAVKKK